MTTALFILLAGVMVVISSIYVAVFIKDAGNCVITQDVFDERA